MDRFRKEDQTNASHADQDPHDGKITEFQLLVKVSGFPELFLIEMQ